MSVAIAAGKTSRFQAVLDAIESLPVTDQAMLAEVVTKRVAAKRRRELVKEIAGARSAHSRGKVSRGTAADFISQLRAA